MSELFENVSSEFPFGQRVFFIARYCYNRIVILFVNRETRARLTIAKVLVLMVVAKDNKSLIVECKITI